MNNPLNDFVRFRALRAEKHSALLEMLQDPDNRGLIDELEQFLRERPINTKTTSGNGNGNGAIVQGHIIPSIRGIYAEVPRVSKVPDLINILKQHQYDFQGKDEGEIVRGAVLYLSKGKSPIFRIKRGVPGTHNELEKIA